MTRSRPDFVFLFLLMIPLIGLGAGCGEDGPQSVVGPDASSLSPGPFPDYDPEGEKLKIYRDWESFDAATGPLNLTTFESLPGLGSSCGDAGAQPIPNPLFEGDLVFKDPECLKSFLCPAPLCESTNIVLHMGRKSTVEFPPGTNGALLMMEGMGNAHVTMVVVDWTRKRHGVQAFAIQGEKMMIGFTHSSGIMRIKIIRTNTGGPVVLSTVAHDGAGELNERIQRRGVRLVRE